jgi:hypothetical protein
VSGPFSHSPNPRSHLTAVHWPHCHPQRAPSHSHSPVLSLQYPPTPPPQPEHQVVSTFSACQSTPPPSTSEFAHHGRPQILSDALYSHSLPFLPRLFVDASYAPPLLPRAYVCCQVSEEIALPGRRLYGPALLRCHKNQRLPSSRKECRRCTVKHYVSRSMRAIGHIITNVHSLFLCLVTHTGKNVNCRSN